ncbi:DUF1501 domain-containing protein [Singulisphaera sp. Ch08]|uniref:DUF1501 domain-containing protein n=1 Tax=Singulisphaera sp. Ch08 TaxID=3120278 RepID=A0AAU7CJT4_9BACT
MTPRTPDLLNWSRRRVLTTGVLPFLGLNLPQLFAAEGARRAPKSPAREMSCIFIFQYGGLSQIDSWDPKPDGPSEVRGPYRPIATSVPGFQVGELMPRLARLADKYCVIRSMSHNVPVHDIANRMLLAGQSLPPLNAPSFGAVVSKLRPSEEGVPSQVWLQKFSGGSMPPESSYMSGGLLGMAHAPMLVGVQHDDNPANPGFRVNAFDMPEGLTLDRIHNRMRLLDEVNTPAAASPSAGESSFGTLARFRERAVDLVEGSAARRAFDIDRESAQARDRYGRHPLGQNLLMARRLIEAGVRLVNVVGWCGLAPGEKFNSLETWDMHGNGGIDIFGNGWNGLGWALPCCDQAVSALLEDLDQRGLLDTTLVVLVGEFGRTARISRGASAIGRDHWSNCYSAMLAGAGVRGGLVYGRSDKQASYVMDRPVSPEDFAATLFHTLGIPPETPIHPDGFSVRASTGQPILDLF